MVDVESRQKPIEIGKMKIKVKKRNLNEWNLLQLLQYIQCTSRKCVYELTQNQSKQQQQQQHEQRQQRQQNINK